MKQLETAKKTLYIYFQVFFVNVVYYLQIVLMLNSTTYRWIEQSKPRILVAFSLIDVRSTK